MMSISFDSLDALINNAIVVDDVIGDTGGGFISLMARNKQTLKDIPAAFEMYTLLQHQMRALPLHETKPYAPFDLAIGTHGVLDTDTLGRVLFVMAVHDNFLNHFAHWITDALMSNKVKGMAGFLALPFSLQNMNGQWHLIPEWVAAFYPGGQRGHCVPLLTLQSMVHEEKIGSDWVQSGLHRLSHFGLPVDDALGATDHVAKAS